MKPLRVAIDTSIFENANYLFDGHDLSILKKHVIDGKIEGLIISDVVLEEAKRHFLERAKEVNNKISKVVGSRDYNCFAHTPSIKRLKINPIAPEQMAREQNGLFLKYLKETKMTKLKSAGVKVQAILKDYFENNPPFGGGDKKHEFPDAIIISSIKEDINKNGELLVVSSDGDWKSALENYPGVKFFDSLKQLFDFITHEEELAKKAVQFYNANYVDINSRIESMLRNKTYDVNGISYDRHGIMDGYEYEDSELLNVVVKSQPNNIDHISDDEVIATIKVTANLEFNCEFLDENDSIWDSEDKEYFYREYGLMNESHEIEFYVTLKYRLEDGEVAECNEIEIDLGNDITLDEDTLVDRSYIEPEGLWEKRKHYTCPTCRHELSVNLMDYAQLVSGSERNMGAELEHAVDYEDECPNCGNKYKISGSIWEYPVGALELDDTKIEWEENKEDI